VADHLKGQSSHPFTLQFFLKKDDVAQLEPFVLNERLRFPELQTLQFGVIIGD
jgi:hypothetical protein